MWGDQNNQGKDQGHYAKQCEIIDQYNQHINVSNEYSDKTQKESLHQKASIKIISHHNQYINISNEYNNQVCIQ